MLATRILIVVLLSSTVTAAEARQGGFMSLLKVGQACQVRISAGRWSITVYTKRRKLEVLADQATPAHQP